MYENNNAARTYAPGIGQAVADRTINRKIHKSVEPYSKVIEIPRYDDASLDAEVDAWCKSNGLKIDGYVVLHGDQLNVNIKLNVVEEVSSETWANVSERVALGSASLDPRGDKFKSEEYAAMSHHLRQASILMSGRHLQHGDKDQESRPGEVFTNCLDGSTRILTMEYGPIEIEKVADEVVTVIAGDGVPRNAKINRHGKQELFEIVFRANAGGGGLMRKTVKATENHRWLMRDGSVTESLSIGDVIAPTHADIGMSQRAIVHGLIFGDGSAHKSRHDHVRHVSQGRSYVAIRVCKQDAARAEIHEILDAANYKYTTPSHANGDRVYYLGKEEHFKDLPFCNEPEYIAGFIYGWWLADGAKAKDIRALEISTSNEAAANWLEEYCAYAGFSMTAHRVMDRKDGDGSFVNGKALHVMRVRRGIEWKVDSMASCGHADVFCPEEPVTSSFVLANGLLTGNCSSSAMSFLEFYLLLNGSGVGRAYDDSMIVVDFNNLPIVVPVIDMMHKDVQSGEIVCLDKRNAEHLYANRVIHHFEVPDSREGWTKAVEKMEYMTFTKESKNEVLMLDFSIVRPRGSPIKGMQNRPASGPGALITAIKNVAVLRDSGMAPWRAAMYADHYFAECVLVGGARRAARMATKFWRDKTVLDFIQVKRGGFLWSSNNSVTVDQLFWTYVKAGRGRNWPLQADRDLAKHALDVYEAICQASYFDKTGEPGLINQDMLTKSDAGIEALFDGNFAESSRYKLDEDTGALTRELVRVWKKEGAKMIVNPCGEIPLSSLGAYCTIADVVPFHSLNDDDAEDSFRVATRALIRTNLMSFMYDKEVKRTNRIGVGMTGIHEYAWTRFEYGWKDLVNESVSLDFWLMLSRFKRAVQSEARDYSKELGVVEPHTNTTLKPAGTTSKLFSLTEGAHLPSMREYLRWVQFRNDDPMVEEYRLKGYPVRLLKTYSGTTIVGFPTRPLICSLGMGDKLVTAAEATPEEQYQYLRLLEKYWLTGVEEDGVTSLEERGGQVSYTLKYDPKVVSFDDFKRTLLDGQSSVRCCSVMPQEDATAYEYQPEQPVNKHEYQMISDAIKVSEIKEDIGFEHVDCGAGGCPVSFGENA